MFSSDVGALVCDASKDFSDSQLHLKYTHGSKQEHIKKKMERLSMHEWSEIVVDKRQSHYPNVVTLS